MKASRTEYCRTPFRAPGELQLSARRTRLRRVTRCFPVAFAALFLEAICSSAGVEAFELSTERRARERQEYEQLASEKEALRALVEEEQRREEEQRAREEIAQLRQEQVTAECFYLEKMHDVWWPLIC